jgi:hypothetical protein
LRSAQVIDRFCASLDGEISQGHVSESLRLIRASEKPIAALRQRSAESADVIEQMALALAPEVEAAFGALLRSFPAAAKAAGLELDQSSKHPTYTLGEGFLRVEFEKRRLETRIQPRDGKRSTFGIDLPVITTHVRSEVERLFNRPFDARTVMSQIESAYEATVSKKKSTRGENIPIAALTEELARDKSFKADEFNVDLSRLVRAGGGVASRLHLDNSRDAKNGVLLWQLDQRGYYGYIGISEGPES